ncbi:MAG: Stf0 family sulfotransferase, partial [Calditrichia bacterium]
MHKTVTPEYDFNPSSPAALFYMICSVPRSGSTLLSSGLWDTKLAGAPMEYFNKSRWMPQFYKRWQPESFEDYIELLKGKRTGPNGVFGFKIHLHDFTEILGKQSPEQIFPGLKYIFIKRRNHLEQAISYVKAMQTGQWSSDMPLRKNHLNFDFDEIKRRIQMVRNQEKGWKQYFDANNIDCFEVVYEDFVKDYESTLKGVLNYLNIEMPAVLTLNPPSIDKQRDELSRIWKEQYLTREKQLSSGLHSGRSAIIPSGMNKEAGHAAGVQDEPVTEPDGKKIIIVQGGFPALSATFILDQITGLIDRGFEIENWSTYNPNEEKVHEKVAGYQLLRKTRWLKLPPQELVDVPEKWLENFLALNQLKMEDLQNATAFHVHYGPNFNLLAPLFRILPQFVIVSFHGYDASRILRQHGKAFYKELGTRAGLITTPGFFMKKELVRQGLPEEKITVHRYGVDTGQFRPLLSPFKKEKIVLLTVARLVEKKGLAYSLRAYAALKTKMPTEYRIIGQGPLLNQLQQMAVDLEIEERVKFPGAADRKTIIKEMQAADIFVLTSITASDGDQEGVPVSLIEAQAAGLPVISTVHTGIPELVEDGSSGFLSGEKDIESIREQMEKLIGSPALRSQMSRKARALVESEFDISRLNDRLAAFLNSNKWTDLNGLANENLLALMLAHRGWSQKYQLYYSYLNKVIPVRDYNHPEATVVVIAPAVSRDTLACL